MCIQQSLFGKQLQEQEQEQGASTAATEQAWAKEQSATLHDLLAEPQGHLLASPQGATLHHHANLHHHHPAPHAQPSSAAPRASSSAGGKVGALFLAVCRGKVSEGLDFADHNARAVIVIGLPFPNAMDSQVKLKKSYNSSLTVARGLLSGEEWYTLQAFRAVNQAVGRCIRHIHDYGSIILIDHRLQQQEGLKKNLSGWVRECLKDYSTFEECQQSLTAFFDTHQAQSSVGHPPQSTTAGASQGAATAAIAPARAAAAPTVAVAVPPTPATTIKSPAHPSQSEVAMTLYSRDTLPDGQRTRAHLLLGTRAHVLPGTQAHVSLPGTPWVASCQDSTMPGAKAEAASRGTQAEVASAASSSKASASKASASASAGPARISVGALGVPRGDVLESQRAGGSKLESLERLRGGSKLESLRDSEVQETLSKSPRDAQAGESVLESQREGAATSCLDSSPRAPASHIASSAAGAAGAPVTVHLDLAEQDHLNLDLALDVALALAEQDQAQQDTIEARDRLQQADHLEPPHREPLHREPPLRATQRSTDHDGCAIQSGQAAQAAQAAKREDRQPSPSQTTFLCPAPPLVSPAICAWREGAPGHGLGLGKSARLASINLACHCGRALLVPSTASSGSLSRLKEGGVEHRLAHLALQHLALLPHAPLPLSPSGTHTCLEANTEKHGIYGVGCKELDAVSEGVSGWDSEWYGGSFLHHSEWYPEHGLVLARIACAACRVELGVVVVAATSAHMHVVDRVWLLAARVRVRVLPSQSPSHNQATPVICGTLERGLLRTRIDDDAALVGPDPAPPGSGPGSGPVALPGPSSATPLFGASSATPSSLTVATAAPTNTKQTSKSSVSGAMKERERGARLALPPRQPTPSHSHSGAQKGAFETKKGGFESRRALVTNTRPRQQEGNPSSSSNEAKRGSESKAAKAAKTSTSHQEEQDDDFKVDKSRLVKKRRLNTAQSCKDACKPA